MAKRCMHCDKPLNQRPDTALHRSRCDQCAERREEISAMFTNGTTIDVLDLHQSALTMLSQAEYLLNRPRSIKDDHDTAFVLTYRAEGLGLAINGKEPTLADHIMRKAARIRRDHKRNVRRGGCRYCQNGGDGESCGCNERAA